MDFVSASEIIAFFASDSKSNGSHGNADSAEDNRIEEINIRVTADHSSVLLDSEAGTPQVSLCWILRPDH